MDGCIEVVSMPCARFDDKGHAFVSAVSPRGVKISLTIDIMQGGVIVCDLVAMSADGHRAEYLRKMFNVGAGFSFDTMRYASKAAMENMFTEFASKGIPFGVVLRVGKDEPKRIENGTR